MKYGYCRISRPKQSIERQIRNIKAQYQDSVIVQEVFTRTRMDRRQWQLLMKRVKAGDTIIFDSVSRMSGNAEEGFAAYEELFNRGVNLVFLKEPHINTDTYKKALENNVQLTGSNVDYILEGVNRYLMELAKEQIRLAFEQSEKEVEDLHQRTREGIETARLNGKQIGRKKDAKITTKKSLAAKEIIRKHSRDFNGTLSDVEVMQLTGLSRNTYYYHVTANYSDGTTTYDVDEYVLAGNDNASAVGTVSLYARAQNGTYVLLNASGHIENVNADWTIVDSGLARVNESVTVTPAGSGMTGMTVTATVAPNTFIKAGETVQVTLSLTANGNNATDDITVASATVNGQAATVNGGAVTIIANGTGTLAVDTITLTTTTLGSVTGGMVTVAVTLGTV